MEIKGNIKIRELSIKRFYFEGLEIISTCPKCKSEHHFNGYVSYPSVGYKEKMYFYCPACDLEWVELFTLTMEFKN